MEFMRGEGRQKITFLFGFVEQLHAVNLSSRIQYSDVELLNRVSRM